MSEVKLQLELDLVLPEAPEAADACVQRLKQLLWLSLILLAPLSASAQEPQPRPDVHEHVAVTAPMLTPANESSGTSWLPQATPMYGIHQPWYEWDVRVNGVVVADARYEPGDRHRTGGFATRQIGSTNWGMLMARRNAAGGRFGVRSMFSAEPWTVSDCGSISFLAAGEVCEGDSIHDRQQPHDFVMELAIDYDRPLRGPWRWQVYAGAAGEPAIGVPGYPHRASALANPVGPISHHWLESTPTFGVVTVGVHNQRWKAEGSVFNGREPDDSRIDLDFGGLDSVALRVSFLPTDRIAVQVSGARLRSAWTDFPFRDQDAATRLTASAIYHRPFGVAGIWATSAAVGTNHARERVALGVLDATSAAALVESSATFSERHTVFGRAEVGGMPAHHLHAHEFSLQVVTIGKLQVGYVRHIRALKGIQPGVGGTLSLSFLPPELAPRYSGSTTPSFGLFFSLHAARHRM